MTGSELVPINETESDEIVVKSFERVIRSVVNKAQFEILLGRTPASVIKTRPGPGGMVFSYVPHGYVTAVLNRAFGFDWDFETLPYGDGDFFKQMPAEPQQSRKGSILVQGCLTVRVRNPDDHSQVIATIIKTATGEKQIIKGMSWGGMIKSAESDALKKAASKLGVALDLYWQDADEDYIPPSPEMLAVREAKRMALQMFDDGARPAEIQEAIKLALDIEVPIPNLHKWNKNREEK